jgi:hypothetical protein
MITGQLMPYSSKSLINPVSGDGAGGGGGSRIELDLSPLQLEALAVIQEKYTNLMATEQYALIPTDYIKYLQLYDIISRARVKYSSNVALRLLFDITSEGLTGSLRSFGLHSLNVELEIQNSYLQGVIQEMINKVNYHPVFDENAGTFDMYRKLQLAPLFRYYIKMYGLPAPGVGFDPDKLNVVLQALQNSGIDPYM